MSIPPVLLAIALMALTRASLQQRDPCDHVTEIPRVSAWCVASCSPCASSPSSKRRSRPARGCPTILVRHILPNTLAPLLVQATYICASAMITEAMLSFIGAGHATEHPELGQHHGRGRAPCSRSPARSCCSPGCSCRSPCWRSTCWATACATRSTRASHGGCSDGRSGKPSATARVEDLRTHLVLHARRRRARRRRRVVRCSTPARRSAIVGESGCGKSVTAMSILRLLPCRRRASSTARIAFEGARPACARRKTRCARSAATQIAMIFQEPMTSLNPVLTIGRQIAEALMLHQKAGRMRTRRTRAIEMLRKVAHSRSRPAHTPVSAPAFRRHAPARDDRDGAGLRARAADRRRTHHRARCDHPGADPRADARAAATRRGIGHLSSRTIWAWWRRWRIGWW